MKLELVDAYTHPRAHKLLYDLLTERQPDEAISHKAMPDFLEHCRFVDSRPYQFWYLLRGDERYVGAIYLTERLAEIGCWIFDEDDSAGIRAEAIRLLMQRHPRPRYCANLNPRNKDMAAIFAELGFRHIQNTYERLP